MKTCATERRLFVTAELTAIEPAAPTKVRPQRRLLKITFFSHDIDGRHAVGPAALKPGFLVVLWDPEDGDGGMTCHCTFLSAVFPTAGKITPATAAFTCRLGILLLRMTRTGIRGHWSIEQVLLSCMAFVGVIRLPNTTLAAAARVSNVDSFLRIEDGMA